MAGVRAKVSETSAFRGLLLVIITLALCGCAEAPTATERVATFSPFVEDEVRSSAQAAPTSNPTILSPATHQPDTPIPTPARTQMALDDGAIMLFIPKGDFLMGSLKGEGEKDEYPQHTVQLNAFWIDQTEVTNRMYRACVADGVCNEPRRSSSFTREEYYGNPQYLDYPVVYVNWFDAGRYCRWAGKRLPSEAEWEKAARGSEGFIYPWGNIEPGTQHANYDLLVGDTTETGSYPAGASPYGALDMAGNVMEWVLDWYGEYTTSPYKTYDPSGPENGAHRIARGGSYLFSPFLIRSAERYWVSPYYADDDLGFRCAFSAVDQ